MRIKLLAITVACLGAFALSACDQQPSGAAATSVTDKSHLSGEAAFNAVQKEGSGFSVGAANAQQTVYVFFDPQCPHCAHLWLASQPLLANVRFVWMPVGVLAPASAPQGATILGAPDPVKAMMENEQSIADNTDGISADRKAVSQYEAKVEANSNLFLRVRGKDDGVPFIIAKVGNTLKMKSGALPTDELKKFLELSN